MYHWHSTSTKDSELNNKPPGHATWRCNTRRQARSGRRDYIGAAPTPSQPSLTEERSGDQMANQANESEEVFGAREAIGNDRNGIENPSDQNLRKFDRKPRAKKVRNDTRSNPHDPDAGITKSVFKVSFRAPPVRKRCLRPSITSRSTLPYGRGSVGHALFIHPLRKGTADAPCLQDGARDRIEWQPHAGRCGVR